MKSFPDEQKPEPLALRSKALSLELLLSALENSGVCFRSSVQFISLIKEDLVQSLLKNCVTPIESIFRSFFPSPIPLPFVSFSSPFLSGRLSLL